MDIVARTLLNFVQQQDGYKNAVLAGGSVRDFLLNGERPFESNDYDIFIPKTSNDQKLSLIKGLRDVVNNQYDKSNGEYPEGDFSVNCFTYQGKTFDLIIRNDLEDSELFGENLIDTFNFGINMAYYDGLSINTCHLFDQDIRNYTATLVNCSSNELLVKSMKKFINLETRWGLRFKSTCFKFEGNN